MSINIIKNGNTNFREIVSLLIKSLNENVQIQSTVNDYNKISSFTTYIYSRYIEKLTSISLNYIRLDWIINQFQFNEIIDILKGKNETLNKESEIELIATILRPLTEIYIELKLITLCKSKYSFEIEDSCKLIYFSDVAQSYQLKRTICNEFYSCDPKYYKLWLDNNAAHLNKMRQDLSKKEIPLLMNIKNKYKKILENYSGNERLILGHDYLTHYSILSRKIHFSYSNIPISHLTSDQYLGWCLLYILLIYEILCEHLELKDDFSKLIAKTLESFHSNSENKIHPYNVGDYIMLEFGIAKIIQVNDLTFEIEYYISNCFETGETDSIPKVFIIGRIDNNYLNNTFKKYYSEQKRIYQDDNYEKLHIEIHKHCQPHLVNNI